jgi:hypothetical protein
MDMRAIRFVSVGVSLLAVLMATPVFAQQASIAGVVTDESKAVLPGVTVTVTDVARGTQVIAVSDERGQFRVPPLNPGTYKLQAELSGFATLSQDKIDLLVGQNVNVPITMKVATVSETLTVTGQSPLVDTSSTQVAGNVSPTQMQEVPLLGRNWLELSKMVPGMTANVISTYAPGVSANNWAMNLDGQMVANKTSQGLGQPHFSRDAIAEYQIVTNLYDVSQGRSEGVQMQAITKSGTNSIAGSGYGFFRSDSLNAADAVSHTVLPYQDRQYGGTVGGPLVKDKLFYFLALEAEQTPASYFDVVQALNQTFTIPDNVTQNSAMMRLDDQLSKNNRLSFRGTWSNYKNPAYMASPTNTHPSQQSFETQGSLNGLLTWSNVLSSSAVQELRVGWKQFTFSYVPEIPGLATQYNFPGLTLGPVYWMPQWHAQKFPSARYDLTLHHGSHDLKIGAEFLSAHLWDDYWNNARGQLTFTSLPNNIASLIPPGSEYNPSLWNLGGLNSIAQRFNIAIPKTDFTWVTPDPEVAGWIGDNWKVSGDVTINYGVRYDNFWYEASPPGVTTNSINITQYTAAAAPTANQYSMQPGDFGYKSGTHDNLDFGPQAGAVWNVGGSGNLTIHGGTGLYYTVYEKSITKVQILTSNLFSAQFNNNGTNPNFVLNPTGGINTYAQAITTGLPQGGAMVSDHLRSPMSWQSGVGFSKQFGANTGLTSDLVLRKTFRELETIYPNLLYNPATGYNINPSVATPNPAWGQFSYATSDGKGMYSALQSSLTRRLTKKIQGGASHTLMFVYNDTASTANNPFNYVDGEYGRSIYFQRNTLRGWVSYDLPWDFLISGTYSYGSGNPNAATISTNPFGGTVSNRLNLLTGGGAAPAITIPAGVLGQWNGPSVIASGTVIPRDALMGTNYNRMDLRLTKTFKFPGNIQAQLIGELFNVFNTANFIAFNTTLSPTNTATTALFGLPTGADVPREGQLAFRFTF